MVGNFVLRDNIRYSQDVQTLKITEQGHAVCTNDRSAGVYRGLPEMYAALPLADYGDRLIVPGLVNLHLHTPRYSFRKPGMDLELLEWLSTWALPEEAKYKNNEYTEKAYPVFTDNMKHSVTARACIFTTLHRDAMEMLMDLMEEIGLRTMVGKVNADRNNPNSLMEEELETLAEETIRWPEDIKGRYENTMPILTSRFIPICSNELMERLKEIQARYDLPTQSHLSESRGETSWVQELCPWSEFYDDTYDRLGFFENEVRTIMAHCVWLFREEMSRIRDNDAFVAHYPQSNANLSPGIAPVRAYLDQGIGVGPGADMAGGVGESVSRAMADAVQVPKFRWGLMDESLRPLTVEGAFYLRTVGGEAFLGKVGGFEEGYEFDTTVLSNQSLRHPQSLGVKERLERFIYLSDEHHVDVKYVSGGNIFRARSSTVLFHQNRICVKRANRGKRLLLQK